MPQTESFSSLNPLSADMKLRRELGFWDAVAIGLASMIGAGIFVVSGIGAKLAGPAVILAFLVAGVVALFNALSSAQLAAAIPREGGSYEYARRLVSPKIGFLTGWLFVASKLLEAATVALAFAAYAAFFLGADPRALAVAAVVALTSINLAGIRASTDASKAMALIKVGVLAVFAAVTAGSVKTSNYFPFAPTGLEGVLAASGVVFFAYTGYARIATLGEEIRRPKRVIPKAILASLAIAAVTYVLVTAAGVGAIGAQRRFSGLPVAGQARKSGKFHHGRSSGSNIPNPGSQFAATGRVHQPHHPTLLRRHQLQRAQARRKTPVVSHGRSRCWASFLHRPRGLSACGAMAVDCRSACSGNRLYSPQKNGYSSACGLNACLRGPCFSERMPLKR